MRIKRIALASLLLLAAVLSVSAQTALDEIRECPEKSGGVYYAYPVPTQRLTPAPKGYKPFYISHYGRHGSRYLLSDNDYKRALDALRTANDNGALTEKGRDVLSKMEIIWQEAQYHGDQLSPLGRRQHRDIAERMYRNYPEVFKQKGRKITARSTTSMRVTISMIAFVERLHELNAKLNIDWDNSNENMQYLNYHTQEYNRVKNDFNGWRRVQSQFGARGIPSERFTAQLISDPSKAGINVGGLMGQIYNVAVDLQNMETDINLLDLFTPEELYEQWRNENAWFYPCDGPSPLNQGTAIESCKPLLKHFVDKAEDAIAGRGDMATLRFGHDGNVIPLAAIMHLKNCDAVEEDLHKIDQVWRDYFVSPMGANIQLIFYKKKGSDDILVKFLHNERETSIPVSTDMAPYYHWKDVKAFFEKQLED